MLGLVQHSEVLLPLRRFYKQRPENLLTNSRGRLVLAATRAGGLGVMGAKASSLASAHMWEHITSSALPRLVVVRRWSRRSQPFVFMLI